MTTSESELAKGLTVLSAATLEAARGMFLSQYGLTGNTELFNRIIDQAKQALSANKGERVEPVAKITYSNWNGMNVEAIPGTPILPVGTLLYVLPAAPK